MENQFSEDSFVLPKSEIDAIKLEASNLSPAKEKEIKEISHEVNNTILKLYGKFMSPEARERLSKVSDRIIILPEEQFRSYKIGWERDNPLEESHSSAFNTDRGDMIVINEDVVNKYAEKLKPIGGTDIDSYTFIIAHETIHFVQNQELMSVLIEINASYCAREICKKLKRRQVLFGDINSRRAACYSNLLSKTGDVVNKVVFGKDKTEENKYYIYGHLSDYREELNKLFFL